MKVATDFDRRTTIKVALVVAAIFGLTPSAANAAVVTLSGSVFYRERMALPDNVALIVEPVDPAKAGEPVPLLLLQVTESAAGASPLAGTAWRLLALDGKDTDAGVTSMLAFNADGTVNGNGGCNTFSGGVTIDGATLKFGELRSTMMACEEAKSKQEAAFFEALSRTASYAVETGELALLDTAGSVVARLASARKAG